MVVIYTQKKNQTVKMATEYIQTGTPKIRYIKNFDMERLSHRWQMNDGRHSEGWCNSGNRAHSDWTCRDCDGRCVTRVIHKQGLQAWVTQTM